MFVCLSVLCLSVCLCRCLSVCLSVSWSDGQQACLLSCIFYISISLLVHQHPYIQLNLTMSILQGVDFRHKDKQGINFATIWQGLMQRQLTLMLGLSAFEFIFDFEEWIQSGYFDDHMKARLKGERILEPTLCCYLKLRSCCSTVATNDTPVSCL